MTQSDILNGRGEVLESLEEVLDELAKTGGSDWENPTLARYLEALRALLGSIENGYVNRHEPLPSSPWTLMAQALRGARYYE